LGGITTLALTQAILWLVIFFFISAPVHEAAHAYAAWKNGDGTAKLLGRISLDPFVHFDPIGGSAIILFVVFGLFSGGSTAFGWAKPTPVEPRLFRGRNAVRIVSLAGIAANLVLAVLFAIGFRIAYGNGLYPMNDSVGDMICLVLWTGLQLNVGLALFNLIPVPPLDGSHVLLDLVSPRTAYDIQNFFNQYGMVLLLIAVLFGSWVIGPIARPIIGFLAGVPVY
jgi:Zn-dependent protease